MDVIYWTVSPFQIKYLAEIAKNLKRRFLKAFYYRMFFDDFPQKMKTIQIAEDNRSE